MTNTKKKKVFWAFAAVTILIVAIPAVCFAVSPSSMNAEVYKYMKVRSKYSNVSRSIMWSILTLLAKAIDYIDSAIDEVLGLNLYNLVIDYLPQSTVMNVAWVVFTVALIASGIILMVNGDKIKLQDYFRQLLISVCFLVAFPSLISALGSFKGISIQTADLIITNRESEIFHGLGEDLLADNLVYLPDCITDGKLHYYSNSDAYTKTSIYDININGAMSHDLCDFKYESSDTTTNQRRYDELTTANKMELLNLGDKYEQWQALLAANPEGHLSVQVYTGVFESGRPVTETHIYCNQYHSTSGYLEYNCPYDSRAEGTYEKYLVDQIAENRAVKDAGKSTLVRRCLYINTALSRIDGVIRDLNIQNNQHMVETGTDRTFRANVTDLRTQEEYDDMSAIDRAVIQLTNGYSEERVYGYGFDFIFTLISMIIVGICLIFSLFKLCRMLYEIVFMRIAVPIFIGSDASGSGRAKKAVMQLMNTFIVLFVVLVLMRIYIGSISWIHTHVDNFVAEWALIFAGMFFVIDGPDFIVKMTGIDAGVKNGAATIMSLKSGMDIARNVAKTPGKVINSASNSAKNTAAKMGENYAKFKSSSAESNGFGDAIKNSIGNSGMGQAFRSGATNLYNNNAGYRDAANKSFSAAESNHYSAQGNNEPGASPVSNSSSDSGNSASGGTGSTEKTPAENNSTVIPIPGEKGDQGEKGEKGEKGEQGLNGRDGKDGADADNITGNAEKAQSAAADNNVKHGAAFDNIPKQTEQNSAVTPNNAEHNSSINTSQKTNDKLTVYEQPAASQNNAAAQINTSKPTDTEIHSGGTKTDVKRTDAEPTSALPHQFKNSETDSYAQHEHSKEQSVKTFADKQLSEEAASAVTIDKKFKPKTEDK